MDVLLVDLALALVLVGLASLIRPLSFLKIRTRRIALLVLGAGVALLVVGLSLPVFPPRLPGPRMAIDEVVPSYQFGEAPRDPRRGPARSGAGRGEGRDRARDPAVPAAHLAALAPLAGQRHSESILNPSADRPILDVALRSSFVLLREEPGREIVFGTVVCCDLRAPPRSPEEFAALQGSLARAVMNFHVEDAGGGVTRLVTQTRIAASDARAERVFARYWRLIYPGSALIRRMWLRAIKARAEAGA